MDQITRLRQLAAKLEALGGEERRAMAEALSDIIDDLVAAQAEDERVSEALVEAAKRKGKKARGRSTFVKHEEGTYMPGALPMAARRAIGKREVAEIFDKHGQAVVSQVIDHVSHTLEAALETARQKVLEEIKHQYGAAGLAEYSSYTGEWADAVVADIFECGLDELRARKRSNARAYAAASAAPRNLDAAVLRLEQLINGLERR